MKAFNFWNVEELAEEGGAGFILRSSACPSADTRRLIRASLIATPPWFISEALAQLIHWCASCQPNDLTSLDVNPPPCGGQQCIHALALLLLMVFMSLQMNRKVKKSTHTHTAVLQRHVRVLLLWRWDVFPLDGQHYSNKSQMNQRIPLDSFMWPENFL